MNEKGESMNENGESMNEKGESINAVTNLNLTLARQTQRYSVDEACRAISEIQRQLEAIEDYRLKLKWWMGHILKHTTFPRRQRVEMIKLIALQLENEYSIRAKKSVLYETLELYEAFAGDFLQYLRWIEEQKRLNSRPVYWYDVQNLVLGGRHNPDVIGQELADQLDYQEAERAIEIIDRIVSRASTGNEEAEGVLEAMAQNLTGLLLLRNLEPRTPRSEEYRRYVASFSCLVCGRRADAHHAIGRAGIGTKASDFGCVPLCRVHHVDLHQSGGYTFERRYGVTLIETAFNLLHRFVTGSWITQKLESAPEQDWTGPPNELPMDE